jgi:DNA helicase HerA-like ATPase
VEQKRRYGLADGDRQRHMYLVGQTGTGKSTFLENLALQDMLEGRGFAFVDPHGDTAEKLLAMVPKERTEDVIYFSPADMDYPLGLNMFEYSSADQKDFLIQEAINMLYKLYDPQRQGIIGPRYEHLFRNAALAVMADPNGGTFVDIPKLFRDPAFVEQKLKARNRSECT